MTVRRVTVTGHAIILPSNTSNNLIRTQVFFAARSTISLLVLLVRDRDRDRDPSHGHGHASGTVPAVRISLLVLKPFSASSKQHKEQQEQACDSVVLKKVNLRTVTVTLRTVTGHARIFKLAPMHLRDRASVPSKSNLLTLRTVNNFI